MMPEELFEILDQLFYTNENVTVQRDVTLAQIKIPYCIKCYGTSISIFSDNDTYLQEAQDNLFGEIFVIDPQKDLIENFVICAALFFKVQNEYTNSLEQVNKELRKFHM